MKNTSLKTDFSMPSLGSLRTPSILRLSKARLTMIDEFCNFFVFELKQQFGRPDVGRYWVGYQRILVDQMSEHISCTTFFVLPPVERRMTV
jgi:hypothetical protein